ncbi:MAG: divalent-cation tolerance protein CutA [Oscillospiraceae bacterium]|nr:divalent-cation tolerance protein CutA [Oscillospiraceae bacterium]
MTNYTIITTTYPDKDSAKHTAKLLVERSLAACVQLLPIESVYTWQGEICDEREVKLLIKSRAELFDKIAELIKENHTYEVPEIVQIPITSGSTAYLEWIDESTQKFENKTKYTYKPATPTELELKWDKNIAN